MGNKILWVIIIIASTFFTKCKKYNITPSAGVVALYNCTPKVTEPYICFDSLLTDSRCPRGGECFWSGNALIKVSFHEEGNTHTFVMSLKGFPGLGYPSDTTVSGYRIIFADLSPYPDMNKPVPQKSEIKASFSISR